jgi:hypothetical protein
VAELQIEKAHPLAEILLAEFVHLDPFPSTGLNDWQ